MTVLTPPGYLQAGTYTAKLDRLYNTTGRAFPDTSTQLRARQGFYTGRAPAYANPSGWDVTMGACAGVIANTFATNAGDYEMSNDGTVQVTVAASSPTLNRQDIVGFQVKDNFYDASGLNHAVPAVIQGATSAGASVDPALPASFIPVVRAKVPAGSSAPTLESLVQYTTNDGGLLRIDSLTQRAAITVPFSGLDVWRHDKGFRETHDGTAYRVPNGTLVTALADVTNPRTNQVVVQSSDQVEYRWSGSAWQAVRLTVPAPLIERRHDANFAVSAATDTKVPFDTSVTAGLDITYDGTNRWFTFTRSGWYDFSASLRWNVSTAVYLWFAKTTSTTGNRAKTSVNGTLNLSTAGTIKVTTGETWALYVWSQLANTLARETPADPESYAPWLTIQYRRPL